MKKISTDILVIGAGPGGMAAALKAYETGAEQVLLVDRLPEPGGILQQCIHNGFGLHRFKKDLTGPEFAGEYIERIKKIGVKTLYKTMAIEMKKNGKVVLTNSVDGSIEVAPKAVVLAMGCRERTRQQVAIPGTRPSGIFTAGVAQRFVNIEGFMPGKSVVVVGSGDIGMIMARRMTLEGAKVHAVTEILPYPGGLTRNIVQCLNDFNIPLHLNHRVINIFGRDRVEGIKVEGPNGPFEIECDTLLFSVGLIPENELSMMMELKLNPVTGGPYFDDNYQTERPGIFICGNAAFVNDLADYVSVEAEVAGKAAAEFVLNRGSGGRIRVPTIAGDNVRFLVPNFITRSDEVTLYGRVTEPMKNVIISSPDGTVRMAKNIVKPGEMFEVRLDAEKLRKIGSMKEFRLDVRRTKND